MPLISPSSEHRRPAHLGERYVAHLDGIGLVAGCVVLIATMIAVLAWSAANPAAPTAAPAGAVDAAASQPVAATITAPQPSTPVAPVTTTTSTTAPPVVWSTTSTVYCEHTHLTKSSTVARDGVVAVSPGNYDRLVGTTWRVLDGPFAGKVVHVEDTGPAADFDIFIPDCAATSTYGRRPIHVQQLDHQDVTTG